MAHAIDGNFNANLQGVLGSWSQTLAQSHNSHTLWAHVVDLAGLCQGRVGAQAVLRSTCCADSQGWYRLYCVASCSSPSSPSLVPAGHITFTRAIQAVSHKPNLPPPTQSPLSGE